jgi:hypothetical protein
MSEADAELYYEKMLEYFGSLPHFEREPKRFLYYVRLYKYLNRHSTTS